MSTDIKWQNTFEVLPTDAVSPGQLVGDKISLPQSALEELLVAASGTGGKSNLYSEQPGDQTGLPSPLTFRLVNAENRKEVYAGILEFSAPDGTVALSPLIADALGLHPNDRPNQGNTSEERHPQRITVQICPVPKGSYVRLRPLEAGYDADDWKALLERQLRHGYTTLTRGLTLSVHGPRNETFSFLVDKLSPDEPAICVVDTDLEVDIEALDEEQARETLRKLMSRTGTPTIQGSSVGGKLDVWKSVEGKVIPGTYVDYTLPSWNRSQLLTITVKTQDDADSDAVDFFVSPKSSRQRALPRQTEHVFGSFASTADGTRTIHLRPSNAELDGAESIMISVHGYASRDQSLEEGSYAIPFSIRAQSADDGVPDGLSATATQPSPDDEQCKNCMQWVPRQSLVLHQNFCLRNNVRCPRCSAVFKKGSTDFENHWHCDFDEATGGSQQSKKKHDDIYHTSRRCQSCEFSTDSIPDLARHRTSVCPGKLILCRFCHLEVPQEGDPFNPSPEVLLSGLTAHELADGARTTNCHLCNKIVRLRDMAAHMKHHELDKTNRDLPPTCRNINCGRTLHGVGPKGQVRYIPPAGEDTRTGLGLCATCFGPLYVSMHDPEGKALRRRIERRYLSQMMTGCGKGHCGNEWCRTGRANSGLDPKPSNAQGVLPLVKPLLAEAIGGTSPLYFCVDEGSHRQRHAADLVAAEGVWDQHWTIAGAEAEGGDPSKMRDWLQAWAPTRY
ncbi:hypothetical protein NLU13_3773 [Sarocladium strictum]|uniref:Ubiquitin-protein ligase E3A N-terminal zinc-binding domain-containing protein n=1 Tax=Sarocladium strictum TaxID=5046 RepID=A0AA39L813_SARSR|nr:hypothetical protein NLU13_3773 [Sarocladium strictum]